jgi:hypothetical protein
MSVMAMLRQLTQAFCRVGVQTSSYFPSQKCVF